MMESLQNFAGNYVFVIVGLVFTAVLLLLEGAYLLWKSYRGADTIKLRKRLQGFSLMPELDKGRRLLRDGLPGEELALERMAMSLPYIQTLQRTIRQSGLKWSASSVLLASAGAGGSGFILVAMALRQTPLAGMLAGAIFAALPTLYLMHARRKRLATLERQLPEAIDLLTRSLRAGHAFSSGIQMIGDEMQEPIAGEFAMVHDEVSFGVSLPQALTNLAERVPLVDLRYFVVAVLIQRESGGNLTEILGNMSRLIRDRLKLLARVRVLSSEGRLSAWILGLMPFALGGAMYLANREFMEPLWTDPIGIVIIKYTLGIMAVGVLMLAKITKIRV